MTTVFLLSAIYLSLSVPIRKNRLILIPLSDKKKPPMKWKKPVNGFFSGGGEQEKLVTALLELKLMNSTSGNFFISVFTSSSISSSCLKLMLIFPIPLRLPRSFLLLCWYVITSSQYPKIRTFKRFCNICDRRLCWKFRHYAATTTI